MKGNMNDGEVEPSDIILLPNSDSSSSIQASLSPDSFLDELLRKNAQTCTHTHTCHPQGLDATHIHTCYHTHTHVIPSQEENTPPEEKSPVSKPQRPLGNREAVRKYREKKKAQTAYLEEEVKKLRFVNQELIRKLQKQAVLESELSRLRALLLDLRGKIDGELGDFPSQKQCNTVNTFKGGEHGVPPFNDFACGFPGTYDPSGVANGCGNSVPIWDNNCRSLNLDCEANLGYVGNGNEKCLQDSMGALVSSMARE